MLINDDQKEKIRAAIASVEAHTYGELVTVLARKADDYRYIGLTWAALLALVSPFALMMSPLWLDTQHYLILQLAVFTVLALLSQWQPVRRFLVPRKIAHWRAANLARRQFLENNLHHTEQESGLLIFVAEEERYVEIIADRGISRHVAPEQWQDIVDEFTESVKCGDTEGGFLRCIERCGELLKHHCPAQETQNELPDHLVIL